MTSGGPQTLWALASSGVFAFTQHICELSPVEKNENMLRLAAKHANGFSIELEQVTESSVAVTFETWRHLIGGPTDNRWDTEDPLERRDAARSILDLVAAGLFGMARLRIEEVGGVARTWSAQFEVSGAWQTHSQCGRLSWNPFRRPKIRVLKNAAAKPHRYRKLKVHRPAWAPWAGASGTGLGIELCEELAADGGIDLAVDGVLDLHAFEPKQVKSLLLAYIQECQNRQIWELRIIHGKGIGHMRRTVHSILDGHSEVENYRLGSHGEGSWGATLVNLKPRRGGELNQS